MSPCSSIAWTAYTEQVGWKRQRGESSRPTVRWYTRIRRMMALPGALATLVTQGSRPCQGIPDTICQVLEVRLPGPGRRDEDGIHTRSEPFVDPPNGLANPALRSVALDGAADTANGRYRDTRRTRLAGPPDMRHDVLRGDSPAFGVRSSDIGGGGETARSLHQARAASYTVSLARFLRRRRARIVRPPGVRMRARNPWVRLRRR